MTVEIEKVINGENPNDEQVWIIANEAYKVRGFALVDRTFDADGKTSNEFRHICVLPTVDLEKGQYIIVFTGKGTNGFYKFKNVDKKYYAVYWGADSCVWNNRGGDTATLISYAVVNSVNVPATKKA